mmetsp:Transcript_35/g.41  ORF Transcript_35/g.41 Transcript_35/m.41 type:complete len:312 (+) Transcript_35:170-1105(+)|eukprot:CAMPEP_0184857770 /NCGR_PEP_ID=MMETSP0580-20130426/2922_1 /TAXON_ID=1118495 /ORGANISM="Dactyliosolen fragilissimus" /LENGTH=311 /DNA_ID=CAMNT_0027353559 /DNA_START=165 /DNA_END=1100 /DNA_ORIENTATION=+
MMVSSIDSSQHQISFTTLQNAASGKACHKRNLIDPTNQSLHSEFENQESTIRNDICSVRDNPRSQVLKLGSTIGKLCTEILSRAPLDQNNSYDHESKHTNIQNSQNNDESSYFWSNPSTSRDAIFSTIAAVFWELLVLASICQCDLRKSILKKIELNGRKYPVELCKGKSGKYTRYSYYTGITKTDGQSTITSTENMVDDRNSSYCDNVTDMTSFIRDFAYERKWQSFHTPRNIVLAMIGELGELAELFQWKGDEIIKNEIGACCIIGWTQDEIDNLQQELADVAIYCLRLADVCGIHDLGKLSLEYGLNE